MSERSRPIGAAHLHRLVHEGSFPTCPSPIEEANLRVRVPVGGPDPAAHVVRHARNPVARVVEAPGAERLDLLLQCLWDALVGVESEDPVVGRQVHDEVSLGHPPGPRGVDGHPSSSSLGDLPCAVRGAAVHHHDLVAESNAFEGLREAHLLVLRDENGRDRNHRQSIAALTGRGRLRARYASRSLAPRHSRVTDRTSELRHSVSRIPGR